MGIGGGLRSAGPVENDRRNPALEVTAGRGGSLSQRQKGPPRVHREAPELPLRQGRLSLDAVASLPQSRIAAGRPEGGKLSNELVRRGRPGLDGRRDVVRIPARDRFQ